MVRDPGLPRTPCCCPQQQSLACFVHWWKGLPVLPRNELDAEHAAEPPTLSDGTGLGSSQTCRARAVILEEPPTHGDYLDGVLLGPDPDSPAVAAICASDRGDSSGSQIRAVLSTFSRRSTVRLPSACTLNTLRP